MEGSGMFMLDGVSLGFPGLQMVYFMHLKCEKRIGDEIRFVQKK
jgi:hypothetical protein